MVSKLMYDEFCDDLTTMCDGIARPTCRGFERRTSSDCDFILNFPSSTIAKAFYKAFSSVALHFRAGRFLITQYIVEFKLHRANEADLLFTYEGRKQAYNKIFDFLVEELGLDKINEVIQKLHNYVESDIKNTNDLISENIKKLKQRFEEAEKFSEKNLILMDLRRFMLDCYQPEILAQFIQTAATRAKPFPLHDAVIKEDISAMDRVLNDSIEIDGVDKGGWTALELASLNGNCAAIDLLVKAGADVNRENASGKRPIYFAILNDWTLAVTMLLKAGADINACSSNKTPLDWALHFRRDATAKVLIEHGGIVTIVREITSIKALIARETKRWEELQAKVELMEEFPMLSTDCNQI